MQNQMSASTEELEISVEAAPPSSALFEQQKAEVDIQIATAHAYPRNVTKSVNNAIAIVSMDEQTAKTCHYALPRGGKTVAGPSVHLAKILAQCWGNMRIDARVVSIDQKHITSQAVAFDLENNLAIRVEVKRSIMQNEYKNGSRTGNMMRMNDDMITVTGNAANAIALRNAVFAVIPKAIVDKAYDAAKGRMTGDVSDGVKLIAKRKQVIDALKDTFSITDKQILQLVSKAAIEHINADDIVTLIGVGTALKDGDTTIDQLFKAPLEKPEQPAGEKGAAATSAVEEQMKGGKK